MKTLEAEQIETMKEIQSDEERQIVYLKDDYQTDIYGCRIVCTAYCACASKQKKK